MRALNFFIALLFCQCSYAQWFNNVTTFTTQNGLSNNTITCLQKDETGFLWIGTHEGLNRYDGTEFINVLSNEKNNLPSNNIKKIVFINKTTLVVGTDAGLCLLNTATLTGERIELPFDTKFPNTGYYIEDLLYKKNAKELWVSTLHGVFVLNEHGKLLKKLMTSSAGLSRGYFAKYLFKDAHEDVYFFSPQNTGFYYPDFAKQALVPAEKKLPGFKLNDFIKDKFYLVSAQTFDHESVCVFSKAAAGGNDEYISYDNTLSNRNFVHKVLANCPNEKRLFSAFPLNDSIFLVNSFFGEPLLYNSNSNDIRLAADHPLWFTSWPDGFGAYIYKDENNIWVATSKGLLQSSLKTNFFKNNSTLIKKINSYSGLVSYDYGMFDNNKLYLACMGAGLFSLDTFRNSVDVFFNQSTPEIFRKKMVSMSVFSAGQSLWLFSIYGPIQVNATTKKMSLANGINKDASFDDNGRYPMKDSKGNIWTTLPNGIAKYNIQKNAFVNYKTKYEGGIFPLVKAYGKTEDGNGNIWMGSSDTLVKLDVAKNTFSTFLLAKNGKALRPILSLASDGGDLLYIDVAGAFGIYHISTKSIDLFTKQTGIISTAINDIASDADGNAWIATEGGLVFYNKQKMKFSSFTRADGLPDDDVIGLNFADSAKKILFLGFAKTYCLFEPQNFLLEKKIPENVITHVEVDGESFSTGIKQIFSYKQNSISFTYTGINYNQGQQNNYACMLEGFDQDWKYPGKERKVNYINLPPNKYTFKVKSANHQGEWNEQPATFEFEITPPFWQQWWFRILMISGVIFSVYYLIKRRDDSIQKDNKIKLQMSELRMQALRAQMNPHFIFNSLNSIQNYILSNNTIDAAAYLSKFAKLMRRILDQSKHNFLPLGEVMETLKMYVEIEAFRFNNEFIYQFNVEENDDLLDARVPPMLLQPFVENAILHGLMPKAGDKKLIINCSLVNANAEITIDDNGIGRTQLNAKAGHTSQGEKLTAGMLESLQQIQNIKASIEITDKTENEISVGTTVKFILPLK